MIWNELQQTTIAMTDTIYVGLANCSHIDSVLNDAIFEDIRFNGTALSNQSVETNSPFQLFPNPANNQLNLKFSHGISHEKFELNIYATNGQLILNKPLDSNVNDLSINTSEFATGTYILELIGKHKYVSTFQKK